MPDKKLINKPINMPVKKPNKIVVDRSPYYTRCAVLLDGSLHEIHIMPRGTQSAEGNIYVGRVENISKGIDAAFINIGLKQNAFLYVEEKEKLDKLKNGQSVLVQALKDASKGKSVYLTTNISFAGTYTILFPDGHKAHVGVSAKITDKEERRRLSELVRPFVPAGCSVIVRTGAKGLSDYIVKDLEVLVYKMNLMKRYAKNIRPPALVFEEKPFIEKILRDTVCYDIDEVIVNDPADFERLKPVTEKMGCALSMEEGEIPFFEQFSIENKIKDILHKKVWLKSGAFLNIDETEALVAIDVNTGKSKKRDAMGETLFLANMEAAIEIPRQLRLRNLSGIIVVDFIDLVDEEKKLKVLETLKAECEKDRIKTIVVGYTELGLALITRKKTKDPISRILLSDCNCIGGRKYSPLFVAFTVFRRLKRAILSTNKRDYRVILQKEIIPAFETGRHYLAETYGVNIDVAAGMFARSGDYEII